MLTKMTDTDWGMVVAAFRAARSRRGEKGRDDRKFLEALHYFSVHNITWRALPAEFGKWNSVWKRFWRLSQVGVFEALLANLAEMSGTAHLVQMVDSTIVRAHVSAAGAKGGRKAKLSAARAAGFPPKSTSTSVRTSRRGRFSATRVTTPRPTARRHAGAASVLPSLTERMSPQSRLSFPKSSTRDAPASSKASAKSSASNGSPYAARRPHRTSPPSSPSPACLSWSNPSTPPSRDNSPGLAGIAQTIGIR